MSVYRTSVRYMNGNLDTIDALRAEFDAVNAEIDALSSEPSRLRDAWHLMTLCDRARDIAREYELRVRGRAGQPAAAHDSIISRAIEMDPGSNSRDGESLFQSPCSSASRTCARVNHSASAISPSLNENGWSGSPMA